MLAGVSWAESVLVSSQRDTFQRDGKMVCPRKLSNVESGNFIERVISEKLGREN